MLDHIGTPEIWLTCNYYAYQQKSMENMAEWYPTIFEQTMANNRARLNFDISRRIFDDKIAFEREFIRRYLVECTGEYVLHKPNPT